MRAEGPLNCPGGGADCKPGPPRGWETAVAQASTSWGAVVLLDLDRVLVWEQAVPGKPGRSALSPESSDGKNNVAKTLWAAAGQVLVMER